MYMYMCKWMGFAKCHLGFYSTHIRPVARIVYRKGWFNKQTDRMRLGVGIRLSETAFRVFLRQYDGMIREYVAKSELWIFRKIFELQNWYFCYSLLYVCILKSAPPEPEWGARGGGGGGLGGRAHLSHLPSQHFWHQLWKLNSSCIGGRQVLDHNCSIPASFKL